MMIRGKVTLVGAGCGPDLITVKGLAAVKAADVLVYDDLMDAAVLRGARDGCEFIYAGKRFGRHSMPQEEINTVLICRAKAGKHVVRLHGGDSFVFGRGGEEIQRLQEEGIPFEVIPGVTSAVAVPEHLGIPVTHRGTTRSFTVLTGHTAADGEGAAEDYRTLAGLKGTLVILMGLHAAGEISKGLIAAGKDPGTPAAIVSGGYSSGEKRIDGTLAALPEMAAEAETPAILVIGQNASMHLEGMEEREEVSYRIGEIAFANFASRAAKEAAGDAGLKTDLPLAGVRVLVTGTEHFTAKLQRKLESFGARVQAVPCLAIQSSPERIPHDYAAYSWIVFTSSNGVRIFFDTLRGRRQDLRTISHLRFAVIGPGTKETLQQYGFHADYMPEEYTGEALGRGLAARIGNADIRREDVHSGKTGEVTRGCREAAGTMNTEEAAGAEKKETPEKKCILILRAAEGSKRLTQELQAAGIAYEDAAIYRTVGISGADRRGSGPEGRERISPESRGGEEILHGTAQTDKEVYAVFSSAAGVRAFFGQYSLPEDAVTLAIGEATAQELGQYRSGRMEVARKHSADGIAEELIRLTCERRGV